MKTTCLSAAVLLICTVLFTFVSSAVPATAAEAAVLMEASGGNILVDVNAHTRMPMASTTKIMTAVVALEAFPDLSTEIRIPEAAVGIEGSSVYLKAGETLTAEQLLYALMLESANDAAAAIAIAVSGDLTSFADAMNRKAQQIGLLDTQFTNPHGLDSDGHYTTAYDLALLTRYALQNPDFSRIVKTYKTTIPLNGSEGTRVLVNHNKMLKAYDGAIGVKTGYTKRCGRCLVSAAERDGVTMIAVTLSDPDDWHDHAALLDYGFSQYSRVSLAESGEISCTIPVLGAEPEAVLTASNSEAVSKILPNVHGEIHYVIEANRFLCAPVERGDAVGKIVFYCDNQPIAEAPLVAQSSIPSAAIRQSFTEKLKDRFRIP